MDLSKIPDEALLQEIARRLAIKRPPKLVLKHQEHSPAISISKNAALQQMIRSLQSGVRKGQPFEILKFLVASGESPQTMAQIAAQMKRMHYSATRYYDASNALVACGFSERTTIGYDKAWVATDKGRAWLNGQ